MSAPVVRLTDSQVTRIETLVEKLIALLDGNDGDPDREDIDEREPEEINTGDAEDDFFPNIYGLGDGGPGDSVDAEDDDPTEPDFNRPRDRSAAGRAYAGIDQSFEALRPAVSAGADHAKAGAT